MSSEFAFWPIYCKHCGRDHWREGDCDRQGGGEASRTQPRRPRPVVGSGSGARTVEAVESGAA